MVVCNADEFAEFKTVADGDVNYNTPDPIAAKDKLLSKAQKMADAVGMVCWADDSDVRFFTQILFHEDYSKPHK